MHPTAAGFVQGKYTLDPEQPLVFNITRGETWGFYAEKNETHLMHD